MCLPGVLQWLEPGGWAESPFLQPCQNFKWSLPEWTLGENYLQLQLEQTVQQYHSRAEALYATVWRISDCKNYQKSVFMELLENVESFAYHLSIPAKVCFLNLPF